MQLTLIGSVLASIAFGLVVSGGEHLIRGWAGWRPWLGSAWRLAFLCYIVLFGVIHL
jgi:hypothetical protein